MIKLKKKLIHTSAFTVSPFTRIKMKVHHHIIVFEHLESKLLVYCEKKKMKTTPGLFYLLCVESLFTLS